MKYRRSAAPVSLPLMLLLLASTGYAQHAPTGPDIPKTISYQGAITAPDGGSISDGTYPITITLYGDESGRQRIWQDSYTTDISGGIFSLTLGGGNTPLPDAGGMNRPLWIGVRIADGTEMRPLTQMHASPYAINVPARSITTGEIAQGAVSADNIGTDYISGIRINGRNIMPEGGILNIRSGYGVGMAFDESAQRLVIGSPDHISAGKEGAKTLTPVSSVYWSERGNYATTAGPDFVGTTDDEPFEFHVYDSDPTANRGTKRVMRFSPHPVSPNILGGFQGNSIVGAQGSFIGGGGANTSVPAPARPPGNDYHEIASDYGIIGGGRANRIGEDAIDATILGGFGNQIGSNSFPTPIVPSESGATITGGGTNGASGYFATIHGGFQNGAGPNFSTVGGGYLNYPGGTTSGTVSGGVMNMTSDDLSTISGGLGNSTSSKGNTVGGGSAHMAWMQYSTIIGGYENNAGGFPILYGEYSAIGGGHHNTSGGVGSFAGGGFYSVPSTKYSVVTGGDRNYTFAGWYTDPDGWTFMGGGQLNLGLAQYSAIGGGMENSSIGLFSNVDGGASNGANSFHATVGGGYMNAAVDQSTAAGGEFNTAGGAWSSIGGGFSNSTGFDYATVAGGQGHLAQWLGSTVGGGLGNKSEAISSTISGGEYGFIESSDDNIADYSVITGGYFNRIEAKYASIGGGSGNLIVADAPYDAVNATIPGGDHLTARSYAQTVVGYFNRPGGSMTAPPDRATTTATDDPLFIIGNGDHSTLPAPTETNGFEVSYNGHSTVFDVNRATRDPFQGATYRDNIIYSWGRVSGTTRTIIPNQELGVVSVIPGAIAGIYKVSIRVLDPHTGASVSLTEGSVTATLDEDEASEASPIVCGSITVSPIKFTGGLNTFVVKTGGLGSGGSCHPEWRSFTFKVTGRPEVPVGVVPVVP